MSMSENTPEFDFPEDDAEFAAQFAAMQREQARRNELAAIPTRIQELVTGFVALGGDPADLTLEPLPEPEPIPGVDYVPDPLAEHPPPTGD